MRSGAMLSSGVGGSQAGAGQGELAFNRDDLGGGPIVAPTALRGHDLGSGAKRLGTGVTASGKVRAAQRGIGKGERHLPADRMNDFGAGDVGPRADRFEHVGGELGVERSVAGDQTVARRIRVTVAGQVGERGSVERRGRRPGRLTAQDRTGQVGRLSRGGSRRRIPDAEHGQQPRNAVVPVIADQAVFEECAVSDAGGPGRQKTAVDEAYGILSERSARERLAGIVQQGGDVGRRGRRSRTADEAAVRGSEDRPVAPRHEEEEPASPELSRLLVMAFLIAAALGLLTGIGWMGYQFLQAQFGG